MAFLLYGPIFSCGWAHLNCLYKVELLYLVLVLDRRRAINSYNAIDYLDWRGDLSFSASPFNKVDAFLCSQIATADFTSIIPEKGEITLSEAFY